MTLTEVRVIRLVENAGSLAGVLSTVASAGVVVKDDHPKAKKCHTWANQIGPGEFRSIALVSWSPRIREFTVGMYQDATASEIKAAALFAFGCARRGVVPQAGLHCWYDNDRPSKPVLFLELAYRITEAGAGEEVEVSLPEDLTVESFLALAGVNG